MQQFISKMYIKELKREEECEEQQKLKETEQRNEEPEWTIEEENKKRKSRFTFISPVLRQNGIFVVLLHL